MKKLLLIILSSATLALAGEYPLKTCVVSGEKLGGEMGSPYVFKYEGTEVKLCCSGCKAKFDKNPAKYMAVIAAAAKTQK